MKPPTCPNNREMVKVDYGVSTQLIHLLHGIVLLEPFKGLFLQGQKQNLLRICPFKFFSPGG